jgi:hypothetical protein
MRISSVEVMDVFCSICNIARGLPGAMFRSSLIAHPLDEVFETVPLLAQVENGRDLKLKVLFNLYRQRRGLATIRNRVGDIRFKESDVEDWVKEFRGVGKL